MRREEADLEERKTLSGGALVAARGIGSLLHTLRRTNTHISARVLSFLRSEKLKILGKLLLLQLGLKPKGLTLPNLPLSTQAPVTFTMLHDVPMEVRLYWVMLDLLGRLGLSGEAARGVELAGMSPLRQADVVVCRDIAGSNNETALRHIG